MLRTAVVVPAYRAQATLPRVLAALAPELSDGCEAVVVDSTGDGTAALAARGLPLVRVVELAQRTPCGAATNVGIRATDAEVIAVLAADGIPEPGWLAALRAGLRDGVDGVAGAVVNGYPGHPVARAWHLFENANWLPTSRRPVTSVFGGNFLFRRSVWEELGGFAEDVLSGEDTLFSLPLAAERRLVFAPQARIRHVCGPGLRAYLKDSYKHGTAVRTIGDRGRFPHRRLLRPLLLPAAATVKLGGVFSAVWPRPLLLAEAAVLSPLLALGLAAWSWGLVRGPAALGPAGPR